MRNYFIQIILIASLVGCSTAKIPNSKSASIHGNMGYSVAQNIGTGKEGDTYYLTKNHGSWSVSKTGNILDGNVERISVNTGTKVIWLWVDGQPDAWCIRGLMAQRPRNDYGICSSSLTKSSASIFSIYSIYTIFVGSFIAAVDVDQDAILQIAESSGLLEMVERERNEKIAAIAKMEQESADARLKSEQERLVLDQKADEGSAIEKYQRGMYYFANSSWSLAQEWFEKASQKGSVDAIFMLGKIYKEQYGNSSEAERLWKKAVQGGNVAAKTALNNLKLEHEQELRRRAQEQELEAMRRAKVKEIGQSVCTSFPGTMYNGAMKVHIQVSGATEAVNGSKLQIRIRGIQIIDALGRINNTDRVDGQTVYKEGALIWEDLREWNPC